MPTPQFLDFSGNHNVFKSDSEQTITVFTELYLYGSVATDELANRIAYNVVRVWDRPEIILSLDDVDFLIRFQVIGMYVDDPRPLLHKNRDYKKMFFRIETETDNSLGGISYMDGLNSNTGFFRLDNVGFEGSTTEAHEIGHGWGLVPGTPDGHPQNLNLIGRGQPGIMYPRGTLVDPEYQWNPSARPGEFGGTLKPDKRVATLEDIAMLGLDQLDYDWQGRARLGGLTNVYHDFKPPLPLA
ncbi:hypothetical protein [Larkinella rosea]|uniref:Peptidase M10 n=1 Tax=Larkinella rosea TaxID=2025312 RepID=A0A3P1C0T7_9BACT|nr:hypothetical protein [Larkinella rosea]RRB06819.1 hypothetical protein EHT25_03235 [Larkinella rosea]